MAAAAHAMPPVTWTNALLSRCLTHLPPGEAVTSPRIAALTVGDREALLLHLRRLTFGDRMQCTLTCPQSDCGELMDFELNVSDLLQPPARIDHRTRPALIPGQIQLETQTMAGEENRPAVLARIRLRCAADGVVPMPAEAV